MLGLGSLCITREAHLDFVDSYIDGGIRWCMAVDVSVSLGTTKALISQGYENVIVSTIRELHTQQSR